MDDLEKFYGKQTFLLYGLFAVVPGRSALPRIIFLPFSIIMLFLGTVYQISALALGRFSFELIIELLPTTVGTFGTLLYVPYVAFSSSKQYAVLLSIMSNDLKEERTEELNEIKKQYAKEARMFVNVYTTLLFCTLSIGALSGFLPCFLNVILPLNESRQMELLSESGIFVDREKYFYYLYFFQFCVVALMGVVVAASENMSFIIGQHACGMGAVIGHQLENLTRIRNHNALDEMDRVQLITSRLHRCIEDHQKILHFAVLIAAFYDIPLTLVLVGTFCALTVSLVQITDPKLMSTKMVLFTVCQIFQLFLVSYMGQSGTNMCGVVARNAYNAEWYVCPPNLRKLLQMMIMRSSKPFVLVARNMYALSMENFMAVIQTVTSCYMVLRQSR